jgi:hypothetical protein
MTTDRTELEKAAYAVHWELMRTGYYQQIGNWRKAEECQALADRWQQRRDALWTEAQQ